MIQVGLNELCSVWRKYIRSTLKGGMAMANQKIMCEVHNCSYWGSGNHCTADEIYVVSHTGEHASKTEETDCKTFKPQDI